ASKDTDTMQQQINKIIQEKEEAAEREDYEKAANLRYQEIQLQKQIDKANESQKEMSAEVTVHDIEEIVEEKTGIPVTKLQADEREDYEKAANLRYQEIQLQKQIDKANESQKEMSAEVTVHDIEEIVEEKTGIPVTKLQADEQEKLRNIKDQLSAKVIGQENA